MKRKIIIDLGSIILFLTGAYIIYTANALDPSGLAADGSTSAKTIGYYMGSGFIGLSVIRLLILYIVNSSKDKNTDIVELKK